MKILSAHQIKAWDQYTIENEPISSIDLMERASLAFCKYFTKKFNSNVSILVFAGTGNNGGDALAMARILYKLSYKIKVFVVGEPEKGSADFKENLRRLPKEIYSTVLSGDTERNESIKYATGEENENSLDTRAEERELPNGKVIIDGIFGSGLNRPVEGIYQSVISAINSSGATIISVDIPSGLFCDRLNAEEDAVVKAQFTLTFQVPKLTFFLPENEPYLGEWKVAEIGLVKQFVESLSSPYEFIEDKLMRSTVKRRSKFSHKGTFGHAFLIAGSYGKMGAAVLSAKACKKTGVGLLTTHNPSCGYVIMQTSVPEAMVISDPLESELSVLPEVEKYDAIGVGPGIGKSGNTLEVLRCLLSNYKKPIVIDADALNLLGENRHLLEILPRDSILTPHPKEFERLTEKASNSVERLELLRSFCMRYKCITVLKGAYSAICSPGGRIYFNSTGNPGMATGGSGDVLTGIITSLLAQSYAPLEAAMLGVYLHGFAGDRAAVEVSEESLTASDIINFIPSFFKELKL